jgi:flagellum-specific ATP synthase
MGKVVQVIGLTVEAEGIISQVGEICHIYPGRGLQRISAEVVGFKKDRLILMPYGDMQGIKPGADIEASGRLFTVPVGHGLLGRIVDGFCRPIDGKGQLEVDGYTHIRPTAPLATTRPRINRVLTTGIRAIDGFITCGKGQRMGIFAGSGVGKSTLLGMLARNVTADINVIALIGERGREVQEFIERDLGPDGLARSVVVVSTSDQPALLRIKAAWVATTIAEHFRDMGLDVTLMMDSVTRFAMAQREIGLSIGEPPAMRGYTPSVFATLPRLLERAGTSASGTITGFYTVLVEGDDLMEPITDAVRSILDGHIVLSRELAMEGHFPAVDVLASVSRVMENIASEEHRELARRARTVLSTYLSARDMINIGAYVAGSNADIDDAIRLVPRIREFLIQRPEERSTLDQTLTGLAEALQG